MNTLAVVDSDNPFLYLEPEVLEREIRVLVEAYQRSRLALLAEFVAHYAQALCIHPGFEGTDQERCEWHRVSAHWRWFAHAPDFGPARRALP